MFTNSSLNRMNFDRLIGHEVASAHPVQVHSRAGDTANGFGSGGSASDTFREYRQFAHGPQTPKVKQPSFDVNIPLTFYHNLCRANALPVCIHPDADLTYTIETPRLDELYYPAAGAVFIEERVTLYPPAAGAVLGTVVVPKHELYRLIPFQVPGSVVSTVVSEVNLNPALFICNIYLDDILHLCLLSRVFFRMIRSFSDQTFNVNVDGELQSKELSGKFPVEYIILHERAISAIDGKSADNGQDWHENGYVYREDQSKYLVQTQRLQTGAGNDYVTNHVQLEGATVKKVVPMISELGVSIYDTTFQKQVPVAFYKDYIPYILNNGLWSNTDSQNPKSIINFSQRPGDAQSMGHASISKQRSIKLDMQVDAPLLSIARDGVQGGDVVVPTAGYTKARVTAISSQINFLLGSDGTMSKRYS
jgi:hypothetical protein